MSVGATLIAMVVGRQEVGCLLECHHGGLESFLDPFVNCYHLTSCPSPHSRNFFVAKSFQARSPALTPTGQDQALNHCFLIHLLTISVSHV